MVHLLDPSSIEFVSYGVKYDPSRFKNAYPAPVGDKKYTLASKPYGGLWSSPVKSTYGWKDFCSEHIMTGYYQRHCPNYWETFTRFQISTEANILVIDSLSDFEELLDEYWNAYKCFPNVRFLEFE